MVVVRDEVLIKARSSLGSSRRRVNVFRMYHRKGRAGLRPEVRQTVDLGETVAEADVHAWNLWGVGEFGTPFGTALGDFFHQDTLNESIS